MHDALDNEVTVDQQKLCMWSRKECLPEACRCWRACSYNGKYTAMAGTQTAKDRSVPLHSCAGPSVLAILMRPSIAFLHSANELRDMQGMDIKSRVISIFNKFLSSSANTQDGVV